MATALITGVTGQDGSYLAEYLLAKGYHVVGASRRVASEDQRQRFSRSVGLQMNSKFSMLSCDIATPEGADHLLERALDCLGTDGLDEVYHLAAQSQVGYSFRAEAETYGTNILGTQLLLDRLSRKCSDARVYFAGSSEMLGNPKVEPPWDHTMKFDPCSPYGYSKVAGWHLCGMMRHSEKMYVARGLLFNHESPRRGEEFVTRKITKQIGRIARGEASCIELGNLEARRDWGDSRDYVRAMWYMLQQDNPGDYTVATGEAHSVQEFLDLAIEKSGVEVEVVKKDEWMRKSDIDLLLGDPESIMNLGWTPEITFDKMVGDMVFNDA